jgi:hypothetical protein
VGIAAGTIDPAAVLGAQCWYVTIAPGCAGSRPKSRIVPRDVPRLGRPLTIALFDLPADLAFVFTGLQTSGSTLGPLPLALGPFGMPGCTAYVANDSVTAVFGSGAHAEWTLAIPRAAALLGMNFFQQALVPDPGVNALQAVMSDATHAMIGT